MTTTVGTATAGWCRDDRDRRTALRATDLNGLDYLVVDETDRHRLKLYFIAKLRGLGEKLTPTHFSISGGRRVIHIQVLEVGVCEQPDPDVDDCLTLTVDRIGDFSAYTLCLTHPQIDPVYACLEFSFQAGCPSTSDCVTPEVCPPPSRQRPPIDYLAKDYASFRQLLLDRLSLLLPGWAERHEPDLLIALVELLAYEGDRLSYLQDAAATEAYLGTARQRISLRRHARLVDYRLSEGCNARAWVFVETSQDTQPTLLDDFFFVTAWRGAPDAGAPLSLDDLDRVPDTAYEVFEPMPATAASTRRHVRNPADLCRRLLEVTDAYARFVHDRLRPAVLHDLRQWAGRGDPPPEFMQEILNDLDAIARSQTLVYEKSFAPYAKTGLPPDALQQPLGRRDLQRLNRLLLDAAFAQELAPPGTVVFYQRHNAIALYTWGEHNCCLPRGTTAATLIDTTPALQLQHGDVLLFEEVRSPTTGLPEDADPRHRHVVRLTGATRHTDPLAGVAVLEVTWAPEDALPFPLCLSARGPAPTCEWLDGISIARGNILLVDHGRREIDELDAVEVDAVDQPCDGCQPEEALVPARYRPTLSRTDLTFAQPLAVQRFATGLLAQDPHKAVPSLRLQQMPVTPPRLDLPDPLARYRNPVPLTAFDPEDLIAPTPLLLRLQNAANPNPATPDPAAVYLRGQLDSQTQALLAAYHYPADPAQALIDGTLAALNLALDDATLYDPARFPSTLLDVPTTTLLQARPLPNDLDRLFRRWLLELAFAESLAQSPRFLNDWIARFDLLESGPDDRHVVVEMTDDRRTQLRFGDDTLGQQPEGSTRFRAFYRVGNGAAGNVGAETIARFVFRQGRDAGITLQPRNPLPAAGGEDPELLETARRRAPHAIKRDLVRAVTADDYGAIAVRDFASQLQGAAADLVWTGSWYEAQVTLDPLGREDASRSLLRAVRADLENYRRIGHDLRLTATRYVPLTIVLHVCVKPEALQAHVRVALQDAFSAQMRADGTPGFFHPDNLRFAQSVDVSRIVAAAQRVPGVRWSRVDQLVRLGEGDAGELAAGSLTLARNEIARVDSAGGRGARPGFPELGSITFDMDGGR